MRKLSCHRVPGRIPHSRLKNIRGQITCQRYKRDSKFDHTDCEIHPSRLFLKYNFQVFMGWVLGSWISLTFPPRCCLFYYIVKNTREKNGWWKIIYTSVILLYQQYQSRYRFDWLFCRWNLCWALWYVSPFSGLFTITLILGLPFSLIPSGISLFHGSYTRQSHLKSHCHPHSIVIHPTHRYEMSQIGAVL